MVMLSSILILMPSVAARYVEEVAWYAFFGPMLSFLPVRWRSWRFCQKLGHWETVTLVSAAFEAFIGANLLTAWLKLDWPFFLVYVSVYMICDGGWRAYSVRFTEPRGTLALMFLDEAYRTITGSVWTARHPDVADLVTLDDKRADWQLKIESARAKKGWESGKIMQYSERYFRMESTMRANGMRSFVYVLRALPAGVPSHNVIKYPPATAAVDLDPL